MRIQQIIQNTERELFVLGAVGRSNEIVDSLTQNAQFPDKLTCKILVESEDLLFSKSLVSDTDIDDSRVSFSQLLFDQKRLVEVFNQKCISNNLNIEICYLDIPINFVISDGEIYVSDWIIYPPKEYRKIDIESGEAKSIISLSKYLMDRQRGGKYCAPFRNQKGKITETIELYDENRVRRGIFPRSSFYDSDFVKLVVWVYIFDRNGQLLIHRRAENAEDNQGMWDKSVGGHTDYRLDIDTSKTVPREVIEELVTDENLGMKFVTTKDDDVIFLGDWRPEKRDDYPFREIAEYENNWVYFKIPESFRTVSPRIMPDGTSRRNEVIADVYVFLLSSDIDELTIHDFENSEYMLIKPTDLKSAIENSTRGRVDPVFDKKQKSIHRNQVPKFSPDLTYAFTSRLRQRLEEFQAFVINSL